MGKRLADEPIEKGQELISGDRHEEYGEAIDNMRDIVSGWNVIITIAMDKHGRLLPFHVCLMMDWLKTCRACRSPDKIDSYSDKVGYAGLAYECAIKGTTLPK
jgi:hypothetical protein